MNNADMPAMPLTENQIDRSERGNGYEGLTKREYFAGLAMQAVIAGRPNIDYDEASDHAVNHADQLLIELERTTR